MSMQTLDSKTKTACRQPAGVCFGSRALRLGAAIATFTLLVIAQLQTNVSSSGLESQSGSSELPLRVTGVLILKDQRPISVNGTNVASGATILSGNSIETPDQVAARISLRSLGSVSIAPGTSLSLSFDQKNSLKVILLKGCAMLHGLRGTVGEIGTPQAVAGKTDPNAGGSVSVCFPVGATWREEATRDNRVDDELFGLGKAAALAIVGGRIGATEGVAPVGRGSNPGPSAP